MLKTIRIIFSQLQRNGFRAKWVREMALLHPTVFFYEACLNRKEYQEFITVFQMLRQL
jgi:hypothetical protein